MECVLVFLRAGWRVLLSNFGVRTGIGRVFLELRLAVRSRHCCDPILFTAQLLVFSVA
jgi:hypothetical protein